MSHTLSIITCTGDRPEALNLCHRWMRLQTRLPDQWVIVDDGRDPSPHAEVTTYVRRSPSERPLDSFLDNLSAGLDAATGEMVAVIEDDDWYHPDHLAMLERHFLGGCMAAGGSGQEYYNLPRRRWRAFVNIGASLCQTGFRRELIPMIREAIDYCRLRQSIGVDRRFWDRVFDLGVEAALSPVRRCVGIKGLPGRRGLGIGHRPDGDEWTDDPTGAQLVEWVGTEDARLYLDMMAAAHA